MCCHCGREQHRILRGINVGETITAAIAIIAVAVAVWQGLSARKEANRAEDAVARVTAAEERIRILRQEINDIYVDQVEMTQYARLDNDALWEVSILQACSDFLPTDRLESERTEIDDVYWYQVVDTDRLMSTLDDENKPRIEIYEAFACVVTLASWSSSGDSHSFSTSIDNSLECERVIEAKMFGIEFFGSMVNEETVKTSIDSPALVTLMIKSISELAPYCSHTEEFRLFRTTYLSKNE